jgi:DNA-binding protein HU-beta
MNKAELVEAMMQHLSSTKAEAERALDAFTLSVSSGLKNDKEVGIVGFGKFRVTQRAARMGTNPRTGEKIQLAPSARVRFRAGTSLMESL